MKNWPYVNCRISEARNPLENCKRIIALIPLNYNEWELYVDPRIKLYIFNPIYPPEALTRIKE